MCLAVAGAATLAGVAVMNIGSSRLIAAVSILSAFVIGALTMALLKVFKIVGGAVMLLGVLPLLDLSTDALSHAPTHGLVQWSRILGMSLLIPTFLGALTYCKATNNWDAFRGAEDDKPKEDSNDASQS